MSPSTAALEEVRGCLELQARGHGLSNIVERLITNLEEHGPNLVSFSDSIVDENPWERSSNPRTKSNERGLGGKVMSVEIDLFALIKNFLGHLTILSVMGPEFLELHPHFLEMLWNFDRGWRPMLLGCPRWLPFPGLLKAYIARRGLSQSVLSFHQAANSHTEDELPKQAGSVFGEASQLFKDRWHIWRAHATAEDVKVSADLSLLWA